MVRCNIILFDNTPQMNFEGFVNHLILEHNEVPFMKIRHSVLENMIKEHPLPIKMKNPMIMITQRYDSYEYQC